MLRCNDWENWSTGPAEPLSKAGSTASVSIMFGLPNGAGIRYNLGATSAPARMKSIQPISTRIMYKLSLSRCRKIRSRQTQPTSLCVFCRFVGVKCKL
jgi:hypothetical protein